MSTIKTIDEKSHKKVWIKIHTRDFNVIKEKIAQDTENCHYKRQLEL